VPPPQDKADAAYIAPTGFRPLRRGRSQGGVEWGFKAPAPRQSSVPFPSG